MEWYYAEDKQQKGPVSEEQFAELVRTGVIRADTLVWRQGMNAWLPHGQVAAAPGQPAVPPSAPMPGQTPTPLASLNFTNAEAQRERAVGMVKGPAICLMIYAGLMVMLGLLGALNVFGKPNYAEMPGMDPQTVEMMEKFQGAFGLGSALLSMMVAAVIFYGAWRMKDLKNYGLATAASVLAFLPCNCPCCFLGICFGIWSLVVLNKAEVKGLFS